MDYLSALGIIVSLILFVVTYRQTVGARRQRMIAANADLERILVRRLVLEAYVPRQSDIPRLIAGKAHEFSVRPQDLISELQLLNAVYVRITDSDLIPVDRREEVLQRIEPVLLRYEAGSAGDTTVGSVIVSDRGRWPVPFVLAVLSTLGGTLVTVLATAEATLITEDFFAGFAVTAGVSILLIGIVYSLWRVRSSLEPVSSKAEELSRYAQFENKVGEIVRRYAIVEKAPGTGRDQGFDFLLGVGNRRIAVEAKVWTSLPPAVILAEVADRLRRAALAAGTAEAVIVTPTQGRTKITPGGSEPAVLVMSLIEFRNYLTHVAGRA